MSTEVKTEKKSARRCGWFIDPIQGKICGKTAARTDIHTGEDYCSLHSARIDEVSETVPIDE